MGGPKPNRLVVATANVGKLREIRAGLELSLIHISEPTRPY